MDYTYRKHEAYQYTTKYGKKCHVGFLMRRQIPMSLSILSTLAVIFDTYIYGNCWAVLKGCDGPKINRTYGFLKKNKAIKEIVGGHSYEYGVEKVDCSHCIDFMKDFGIWEGTGLVNE